MLHAYVVGYGTRLALIAEESPERARQRVIDALTIDAGENGRRGPRPEDVSVRDAAGPDFSLLEYVGGSRSSRADFTHALRLQLAG